MIKKVSIINIAKPICRHIIPHFFYFLTSFKDSEYTSSIYQWCISHPNIQKIITFPTFPKHKYASLRGNPNALRPLIFRVP